MNKHKLSFRKWFAGKNPSSQPPNDNIDAYEIHRGKGPRATRRRLYVSDRFHPNFEGEHPRGGRGGGPPTSLPLPSTSRENSLFDGYLEHPLATKARNVPTQHSGFSVAPGLGPATLWPRVRDHNH
ncbi:hypothetical protein TNCV_164261 [Trichonephila clavipes]|nr:hypothetical protein TNCV_164261 [Trichonephila clavipes]